MAEQRPIALTEPPSGYNDWLVELKSRIHNTQQRATLAVNRELVGLYWEYWQRDSDAASRARLGRQGDRPAGA